VRREKGKVKAPSNSPEGEGVRREKGKMKNEE